MYVYIYMYIKSQKHPNQFVKFSFAMGENMGGL